MTQKLTRYLFAFLPPVLWAALIFLLSSYSVLPSFELSTLDFIFKKSAHMFVYAVLYWLLFRGVRISLNLKKSSLAPNTINTYLLWLPLILVFCYSLTDEIHQSFVPGRHGTLRDMGYDMLGVLIVWLRKYQYI